MLGWIVAAIAALFFLSKNGVIGVGGLATGTNVVPPQGSIFAPVPVNIQQEGTNVSKSIGLATQATSQLFSSGGALAGALSQTALSAIPLIGGAISAIASSLFAASAARAKAAKTENAAIAAAIPGWDQGVTQVVNAYNNGQLTAAQSITLLNVVMSNYWQEVGPQIQSGRNGCNSGQNCPPQLRANIGNDTGLAASYCSGDIGGGCCVGCSPLQVSIDNMVWAVQQNANTGKATPALVIQTYASKYGGIARPAYTVTFDAPGALA